MQEFVARFPTETPLCTRPSCRVCFLPTGLELMPGHLFLWTDSGNTLAQARLIPDTCQPLHRSTDLNIKIIK